MLLALDTSTRTVGLALYDGNQVLVEMTWTSLDHHTVELAPAVADVLSKSGISAADLRALAVAIGPGSFTGLRIGLAFAKGLALVHRLPLIGIPTLEALAQAQPVQDMPMAAILKAGRGRLAVAWYQPGKEAWDFKGQIEVVTPHELVERITIPTLVCGELSEAERQVLSRRRRTAVLCSPARCLRRPGYLAELAWKRWLTGKVDDPSNLAPIYLHYNEQIPG